MEQDWIKDIYNETHQIWVKNGKDKSGYAIFYSPVIDDPRIMIIGINPGGDELSFDENISDSPQKHEYAVDNYPLAIKMRKIFRYAGYYNLLVDSVKLNLNFFRTQKAKDLRNKDLAEFCIQKVEIIISRVEPRFLLVEGFYAFDLIIKNLNAIPISNNLSQPNKYVRQGLLNNKIPILAITHPTGTPGVSDVMLQEIGNSLRESILKLGYQADNTILVYTDDKNAIRIAEEFAKNNSMKVYYTDRETDLIAVPNSFILTDINKLTEEAFGYIDVYVSEGIFDAKFISLTEPTSELSIKYSKYFKIIPNIKSEDLNDFLFN